MFLTDPRDIFEASVFKSFFKYLCASLFLSNVQVVLTFGQGDGVELDVSSEDLGNKLCVEQKVQVTVSLVCCWELASLTKEEIL